MANTTTDYIIGQTGILTLGGTDVGSLKIIDYEHEVETIEHEDASDGEGNIDLTLERFKKVIITGTVEELANITTLSKFLGAGSVTASSFPVGVNTNEYAINLKIQTQTSNITLEYDHTKCRVRVGGAVSLSTGENFLGMPVEIRALKDSSGAYGEFGRWILVTA